MLTVRAAERRDSEAWLAMRCLLWPVGQEDHAPEIAAYFDAAPVRGICLLAERPGEGAVGFAELRLREYAEGCATSPVGYLEGIFVLPSHRGRGVGRALVEAGETWAREKGCTEMASDRETWNEASGAFHQALGYEETDRIVCYRRSLG